VADGLKQVITTEEIRSDFVAWDQKKVKDYVEFQTASEGIMPNINGLRHRIDGFVKNLVSKNDGLSFGLMFEKSRWLLDQNEPYPSSLGQGKDK
jgi:hypothetical protein